MLGIVNAQRASGQTASLSIPLVIGHVCAHSIKLYLRIYIIPFDSFHRYGHCLSAATSNFLQTI